MMEMKLTESDRGFKRLSFNDHYNTPCALYESSSAEVVAIWLGVVDAQPKVLASHARNLGIVTRETTGWVDYPLPKEVNLMTSIHLTQDMVKDLLPILQRFAETGELEKRC